MRKAFVLAALATAPAAHALDPALEIGAQGGAIVIDQLDEINTSWYAAPKIDIWFVPTAGLELDVGFSTGAADVDGHGFFVAAPTLSFVGNPLAGKGAPVQPIVQVGAGLMYKAIDGDGAQGEAYAVNRLEAIASFGTGLIIPIPKTPINLRFDAKVWVTVAGETDRFVSPYINFIGTGGLGVKIGLAPDSDKDKVSDNNDLCPNDPEDIDQFEDADGCPDPDNDGDGVLDEVDQCSDEMEDLDGFEDTDGCPDVDNDADGLSDEEDVCPDQAGPDATGGCPDGDGDGVADKDDRCPEAAGLPDFGGCPDSDGDSLPDPDDECPTEAGEPDAYGCPDADADKVPDVRDACPDEAGPDDADTMRTDGCPAKVYLGKGIIRLADGLPFSRGKDRLSRQAKATLDEAGALLEANTDILKVRVEYRTTEEDTSLAKARVASILKHLLDDAGVDRSRLTAGVMGSASVEEVFLFIEAREEPVVEEPEAEPTDEGAADE